MVVTSWSEFRLYKHDGELIGTIKSKEDAVQWAKEARVAYKNPDLKFLFKEISIAEIPKSSFVI